MTPSITMGRTSSIMSTQSQKGMVHAMRLSGLIHLSERGGKSFNQDALAMSATEIGFAGSRSHRNAGLITVICAVADGVSNAPSNAGGAAARVAADTFVLSFGARLGELLGSTPRSSTQDVIAGCLAADWQSIARYAAEDAQDGVLAISEIIERRTYLTTLSGVGMVLVGDHAIGAWLAAGDSPIYAISASRGSVKPSQESKQYSIEISHKPHIVPSTQDHPIMHVVGDIPVESAEDNETETSLKRDTLLTNGLGNIRFRTRTGRINTPSDHSSILLASDALPATLNHQEVATALLDHEMDTTMDFQTVSRISRACRIRGNDDNLSLIHLDLQTISA